MDVDVAINIILDESDPTNPLLVDIQNDKGEEINIGEREVQNDGLTKLRIRILDIINNEAL